MSKFNELYKSLLMEQRIEGAQEVEDREKVLDLITAPPFNFVRVEPNKVEYGWGYGTVYAVRKVLSPKDVEDGMKKLTFSLIQNTSSNIPSSPRYGIDLPCPCKNLVRDGFYVRCVTHRVGELLEFFTDLCEGGLEYDNYKIYNKWEQERVKQFKDIGIDDDDILTIGDMM